MVFEDNFTEIVEIWDPLSSVCGSWKDEMTTMMVAISVSSSSSGS